MAVMSFWRLWQLWRPGNYSGHGVLSTSVPDGNVQNSYVSSAVNVCMFLGSRPACTGTLMLTINSSYDMLPDKEVLLRVEIRLYSISADKSPQNSPFGGMNRHSKTWLIKYLNLHRSNRLLIYYYWSIIETTVSIPTKFCTIIKTTKYSSRVAQTRVQQIQDGGRLPFWKTVKYGHISATVWPMNMLRTFSILPNKTANIMKQNGSQFLLVVKATAALPV